MSTAFERLSLNQKTVDSWNMKQVVDGCVRHGIPWVAAWRDKIQDYGVEESGRLIRESGLKVSSLCRGGMFPGTTIEIRAANIEDNRRAIDEAATIGAEVLVMVCGGLAGVPQIDDARVMVRDGIEAIIQYAEEKGVRIGIEPLHPAFVGDRSVISLLREANDLAEHFATPTVGVVIDIYHVWWDPYVYDEIVRAAPYTMGFHVNDWLAPNLEPLVGRGMMGDGVVDNRRLRAAVDEAGYRGPIEVEIFNSDIWARDPDEVLTQMKERFVSHVL
jgi:sugar phosphate isomerase/epimerase